MDVVSNLRCLEMAVSKKLQKATNATASRKLSRTSMTVLKLVDKYPNCIPDTLWQHARRKRITITTDTIRDQYYFLDGEGLIARPPGLSIFGMRFLITTWGKKALETGVLPRRSKKTKKQIESETTRSRW